MKLSATAVYTTIAPERVFGAERGDDPSEPLFEKKRWVAAAKELERARKNGERFPIFVSDARECGGLLLCDVVEDLKVTEQGTYFSFSHLKGLRDCFTQDLVLASEKRTIAAGFIRPYAMVLTPDFLDQASMDAEERLADHLGEDVTVDLDARELVAQVTLPGEVERWTYFIDDEGDVSRWPDVRRRGQKPEKFQRLGLKLPDGFIVQVEDTDVGFDVFHVPLVEDEPARATAPTRAAAPKPTTRQTAPAPEAGATTLFSWGYEGWGSSLPQLDAVTTAAERARGCEPPVFVDVRFSRSVRAPGFRDRAFESARPPGRYRWMQGMGNAGIGDGLGLRIHRPADAAEPPKLALDEHERRRRVVFFCSCGALKGCHRNQVRRLVLKEAKTQRVNIQIAEWPGGKPEERAVCTHALPRKDLSRILDGGARIPITEELALTTFAALPWGAYVDLTDGERHATAASAARFSAGKWYIQPIFSPLEEGRTVDDPRWQVRVLRGAHGYGVFSSK